VRDRHRELANLLAAPDALPRRRRRDQCCEQRRLPRARLPRHGDSAAELGQRPQEGGGLRRERVAGDEVLERDVADGVAAQGRRQPVGDGRDGGGQARRSVEDPRLHQRRAGVELALGRGQQPLDDLPVLTLARRQGESSQVARAVEVRDPRPLDEDLLDVGAAHEIRQRAEVGDRPQHAFDHRLRFGQGNLSAEA
jgi:hypothetical protein